MPSSTAGLREFDVQEQAARTHAGDAHLQLRRAPRQGEVVAGERLAPAVDEHVGHGLGAGEVVARGDQCAASVRPEVLAGAFQPSVSVRRNATMSSISRSSRRGRPPGSGSNGTSCETLPQYFSGRSS